MSTLQFPNSIHVVQHVMRSLSHVNILDDNERGVIINEVARILNDTRAFGTEHQRIKYGRKSKNREGTDLNSDVLAVLELSSGKHAMVDIILGFDPDKNNPDRAKFASWDGDGRLWNPGENGFFVEVIPDVPDNPDIPDNPIPNTDIKELLIEINQKLGLVIANQNNQTEALLKGLQDLKAEIAKGIKVRF